MTPSLFAKIDVNGAVVEDATHCSHDEVLALHPDLMTHACQDILETLEGSEKNSSSAIQDLEQDVDQAMRWLYSRAHAADGTADDAADDAADRDLGGKGGGASGSALVTEGETVAAVVAGSLKFVRGELHLK